jgi:1,4-dihydroxy-2-naphthoyl-CoA hydrolase
LVILITTDSGYWYAFSSQKGSVAYFITIPLRLNDHNFRIDLFLGGMYVENHPPAERKAWKEQAMGIWFRDYTPREINFIMKDTLISHLGIEIMEIGDDFLTARMPVDKRTCQPMGILHGGASVALAETLGSCGANLVIDRDAQYCVGLEINANHIRSVSSGYVTGTARPLHLGKSTQIWEMLIRDGEGNLVCASRMTNAVLNKRERDPELVSEM